MFAKIMNGNDITLTAYESIAATKTVELDELNMDLSILVDKCIDGVDEGRVQRAIEVAVASFDDMLKLNGYIMNEHTEQSVRLNGFGFLENGQVVGIVAANVPMTLNLIYEGWLTKMAVGGVFNLRRRDLNTAEGMVEAMHDYNAEIDAAIAAGAYCPNLKLAAIFHFINK